MADLSSQPTPLQTIYGWYRSGTLMVNRSYQRKLVWTLHEKQQLIDSILNEYPIPLVLLSESVEEGTAVYDIMDGLQRLHTIVSFIEHGFPLADGRYFKVDEFTRAKEERESGTFAEVAGAHLIARSEVSRILDYVLPVSVIRHATAEVVTDVFGRINSYGHRLSDQERRQAGLISDFSKFVRIISSEVRGDVSIDRLPLYRMPEISVDLSTTKYGYTIQAGDVFWVRQGILRSTELRDSWDEQIVADLAACVLNEQPIERSKEALDSVYDSSTELSARINARLPAYPAAKLASELKYCIELIDSIVEAGGSRNLRDLVFPNKTTNPFPTVFSTIFLAVHEISFRQGMVLADPKAVHDALRDAQQHLGWTRAFKQEGRRQKINIIKGLIQDHFVAGDISRVAFGARRELDITNTIRRSEIETPHFELKQGLLKLSDDRARDEAIMTKVLRTAVAIANIGPTHGGSVFVGVADKKEDANRVASLDAIQPVEIGNRWIVGVDRESRVMGVTLERYYHIWRDAISNAEMTEPLKADLLSNIDMCEYKGMHLLIISVPPQKAVSLFEGDAYIREGDQTVKANAEKLLTVAARFSAIQ